MTTVGYGDLVPVTTGEILFYTFFFKNQIITKHKYKLKRILGGKVVAAVASVCGIIVLAFPISMIIDKFAESTGHWGTDDEEPAAQPSSNRKNKSKR